MEYVALAVVMADDVLREDDKLLRALGLLVIGLAVLLWIENIDVCDVVVAPAPTPTQYA